MEYSKTFLPIALTVFSDSILCSIIGFGYFKDKKRHGNWISYQDSGEKTAMGSYQMGMKNGQWFFWKENELIEVIYEDNKIINVLEWNNSDKKLIAKNN